MAGPFPYSNMVELVQYWGTHDSHRPAFVFVDQNKSRFELSRSQLYQLGGRWASVLHDMGVERGDMVVSTLPNSPERALCDVGIVMSGAVVVNAQCQMADGSDLLHILRKSEARAACVNPDLTCGPWRAMSQHVQHDPHTNTITSATLPHLQKIFFIRRTTPLTTTTARATTSLSGDDVGELGAEADAGTGRSAQRLPLSSEDNEEETVSKDTSSFTCPEAGDFIAGLRKRERVYQAEVRAEDTVIVFSTSGSTGFSKLAPSTHASLLTAIQILQVGSLEHFSMVFGSSSLGWVGGYLFTYLAVGKGRALLDTWNGPLSNRAEIVWDTVVKENCLSGNIMSFLLPKILDLKDREVWKLKSVILSGQPINREMISQALQLADAVIVLYASSELLIIAVAVVTDASSYQDNLVGQPLPFNTVQIRGDDNKEVSRGMKGEIYVKGPCVTGGYLNREEMSFTEDGFFRTGDYGTMRADGSLLVEGRRNDAIHKDSYIFYPFWLESRIMRCCPDLQQVCVVGVPDPLLGQEICACFMTSEPSLDEEHVRRKLEADIWTELEDPMSPRPRYYLRFQTLPMSYTDKPLRKDVQRVATERLNMA